MDKEVLQVLKSIDKKLEKLVSLAERDQYSNEGLENLMAAANANLRLIVDNTNFLKP